LSNKVSPLGAIADRAQVAVFELGEATGGTIYYQVVDELTRIASSVRSFTANNAYKNYNTTAETYTLNVLVQLDSPDAETLAAEQGQAGLVEAGTASNLDLAAIADGINVFAERLYDALDGYARIGKVLVTDASLSSPVSFPFIRPACVSTGDRVLGGTPADFLIETTVPFDSHTWNGWMIDDLCTGFYIGRLGQLVTPWEDDLHLGYTMTHEFMHYAFDAPDLYKPLTDANCVNSSWDGSLMHNTGGWNGSRWALTELDRSASLTPCDHGTDIPWTWSHLREHGRYDKIPVATAPKDVINTRARGNPDGGALEIYILQQRPNGESSLRRYTPSDT
jgi:hypothetical protein